MGTTKASKTSKTKSSKETINGKQIGRNILITVGKEKFSRAFKEKADREKILALVEAFNKRNSNSKKKEIIDLMTASTKASETKKEVVRKKAKKAKAKEAPVAPKSVDATPDQIAEALKLLIDNGYTAAKASPSRRRGEY